MTFTIKPYKNGWKADAFGLSYFAKSYDYLLELIEFYHPSAKVVT